MMTMIFDSILLLALAGFIFYGLFFGLIRTLGSLAGVILGAWAASHWYLEFYNWVQSLAFGHENLGKVFSFIILFVLANRLIGFIFILLDKAFHLISIIPFLKTVNRLAGALFGLIEGGLVLGLLLYVVARYTIVTNWLGQAMTDSRLAPFLLKFTNVITPLLPDFLKQLESIL